MLPNDQSYQLNNNFSENNISLKQYEDQACISYCVSNFENDFILKIYEMYLHEELCDLILESSDGVE